MSPSGGYHAVVLAAGAGSRFGGSKLTAPYGGGVLLDAALWTACAAPVESVAVVTGAHLERVEAAIAKFAANFEKRVRSVNCSDYQFGMGASLRCGLNSLPTDAAGAFIFLGDMPAIPHAVAAKLLGPVLRGARAAVPAFGGRWGHPVLISRGLFKTFAHAGGDGLGRANLHGLHSDLAIVEVEDEGILRDADTPSDIEALSQMARQHCDTEQERG